MLTPFWVHEVFWLHETLAISETFATSALTLMVPPGQTIGDSGADRIGTNALNECYEKATGKAHENNENLWPTNLSEKWLSCGSCLIRHEPKVRRAS